VPNNVSKPTNIDFEDFKNAIDRCAKDFFNRHTIDEKRGSAIHIELFKKETDGIPCEIWTIHKDRYVYTQDLKKTYTNLGVSEEKFLSYTKKYKNKCNVKRVGAKSF